MREERWVSTRVVIEIYTHPYAQNLNTEEELLKRARDIVMEVERHVDGISMVYSDPVYEEICSHCGSLWTKPYPDYNGGCCTEDQKGT